MGARTLIAAVPLSFAVGKAHFYDLPEGTNVLVIWHLEVA